MTDPTQKETKVPDDNPSSSTRTTAEVEQLLKSLPITPQTLAAIDKHTGAAALDYLASKLELDPDESDDDESDADDEEEKSADEDTPIVLNSKGGTKQGSCRTCKNRGTLTCSDKCPSKGCVNCIYICRFCGDKSCIRCDKQCALCRSLICRHCRVACPTCKKKACPHCVFHWPKQHKTFCYQCQSAGDHLKVT